MMSVASLRNAFRSPLNWQIAGMVLLVFAFSSLIPHWISNQNRAGERAALGAVLAGPEAESLLENPAAQADFPVPVKAALEVGDRPLSILGVASIQADGQVVRKLGKAPGALPGEWTGLTHFQQSEGIVALVRRPADPAGGAYTIISIDEAWLSARPAGSGAGQIATGILLALAAGLLLIMFLMIKVLCPIIDLTRFMDSVKAGPDSLAAEKALLGEAPSGELGRLYDHVKTLVANTEKSFAKLARQKNRLKESNERFHAIFESSYLPIFILDPEIEIIADANTAAHDMLGVPAGNCPGMPASKFHPGEMEEVRKFMAKAMRNGFAKTNKLRYKTLEGEIIPAEIFASPLNVAGKPLIMTMARDLRETVRVQERLLQAKEQAEFANRAKTQFLANISHELRTPLNAINGFANIMADEMFGPLGNEKYMEYMGDIMDSGKHLLSIINDILDISKIEAGQMELQEEKTSLPAIVSSCVALVANRARENNQLIRTEIDEDIPFIWADPRALKQVLLNLLSNALKFTPKDGEIVCGAQVNSDGSLVLSVADNGIGISEEHFDSIFEPFAQIDNSLSREFEGTGLGLALCERLVTLHGGTINIESEIDVGTKVLVHFPPERTMRKERPADKAMIG